MLYTLDSDLLHRGDLVYRFDCIRSKTSSKKVLALVISTILFKLFGFYCSQLFFLKLFGSPNFRLVSVRDEGLPETSGAHLI